MMALWLTKYIVCTTDDPNMKISLAIFVNKALLHLIWGEPDPPNPQLIPYQVIAGKQDGTSCGVI